tara:strand:- start:397 stop:1170 length:774 start_codon:yes stop_codon:yes gene_type:complete
MIGFGQTSEDYEDYCHYVIKKLDKFDDIITYYSPLELPISFTKVIDNENNNERIYLSIKVIGSTANAFIKGVKVLLDNGEKLSFPEAKIDSRVTDNAEFEYSCFIEISKQEIELLTENLITDVRLYVYDKKISSSSMYKGFLNCVKNNIGEEEFFMTVEEMPEFPGGDLGLMKYIENNINYPKIAKKYNITGKVYISFIVDKTGSVTNVKVVRGVDKNIDAEAVRVIKSLPKYKPGKQRGKPARVMFTIPINFTLNF